MTTPLLFPLPMTMLSELLAAITRQYRRIPKPSYQKTKQYSNMRATARLVSALLNKCPETIRIEELTGISFKFLEQSKFTKKSPKAIRLQLRLCGQLMDEAHALGWTCRAYVVHLSWRPLQAVIQKRMSSCRKIVDDAIEKGIHARDYSDDDLEEWRDAAFEEGQPAPYLDHTMTWLRLAIRKHRLQRHFPLLNVSLRKAKTYILPVKEIPITLAKQIRELHEWALTDPEFKKTKRTAGELLYMLRELTSYAIENGGSIANVMDAVTEYWVCKWADWRRPTARPRTIEVSLVRLRSLVKQNSLFAGSDYTWLDCKIRSIMKEPRWVRKERKRKMLVPFQLLAKIPSQIRADRLTLQNPTPLQLAWSVHDELFMSMPPWRSANHSSVTLEDHISESEMTDTRWHQLLNKPDWIKEELQNNPHRKFTFFHFLEIEMKGKKEIWEVMDRDLEALYRDYRDHHRPILTCGKNPKTLFLGRDGKALTASGLGRLMADISSRYLPKRISHHRRRDCTAIGMIVAGATYKQVGAALHHSLRGGESTDEYLVGLPSIGRASVLEQEIAQLASELELAFT